MIVPDLDLLIFAYNDGSEFHRKAAAWWEETAGISSGFRGCSGGIRLRKV